MFARKIYYNNKPLILTNDIQQYIYENPVAAGYLPFTGAFPRHYRLAMAHLTKSSSLGTIIQDISSESLLEELHELYEPIEAAGGVVMNEMDEVLMIYRRGKWDLPKGKKDEGEDIAVCAQREVMEETGLGKLSLGKKICDTYHVYAQNGQQLLKRTAWYKMKSSSKEKLEPQKEENILEAKWITENELPLVIFKSYEAIREVLKEAGLKW